MGTELVVNVQNEMLFVGSLFKQPDLYLNYEKFIKPNLYFIDPVTLFFYTNGFLIYKNRTQKLSESIVTLFMTEDPDRYAKYKEYGGWSTVNEWAEIANVDDVENYFQILQKYSLLREFNKKGISTEKIQNSVKFESMTAKQVYFNIKRLVDGINTQITGDPDEIVLTTDTVNMINSYLIKPSMGVATDFYSYNELFRGLRTGTMMCTAATSNSGKTRLMTKMFANLALVQKEKCLILINEMSIEDMRLAILTTVINGKEFQKLHGYEFEKDEKELALGLYRDKKTAEYIFREKDIDGNFIEPIEEYQKRLARDSFDYSKVIAVATWLEEESKNKIWIIDVTTAYTDDDLTTYIKKNATTKDIKYFFYDTLKNELDTVGEWAALKQTVTKLSELAKTLGIFLYASIQLTDQANDIAPLDLNSQQIASSKGLKTILTTLTMWKPIDDRDLQKYYYTPTTHDEGWGTSHQCDLKKDEDPDTMFFVCVVDKNRAGAKRKMVFKVNLNRNTWAELGFVYRR